MFLNIKKYEKIFLPTSYVFKNSYFFKFVTHIFFSYIGFFKIFINMRVKFFFVAFHIKMKNYMKAEY